MNGKNQLQIKHIFFEEVHCDEGDNQLLITQLSSVGSVLFEFITVKEFIKLKMISKSVKSLIDIPIKTAGDHNPIGHYLQANKDKNSS